MTRDDVPIRNLCTTAREIVNDSRLSYVRVDSPARDFDREGLREREHPVRRALQCVVSYRPRGVFRLRVPLWGDFVCELLMRPCHNLPQELRCIRRSVPLPRIHLHHKKGRRSVSFLRKLSNILTVRGHTQRPKAHVNPVIEHLKYQRRVVYCDVTEHSTRQGVSSTLSW